MRICTAYTLSYQDQVFLSYLLDTTCIPA